MAEPLLTKDAINVGGHKLPLPLVGALAALGGAILILRARSRGSSVAAAGTPALLPDQTSVGVLGQGQEAQLANIEQQLAGLGQQPQPLPATVLPSLFAVGEPPGYGNPAGSGLPGSGIPIFGSPSDPNSMLGEIGWNSKLTPVGGTITTGRTVPGRGNQWEQVAGPTGLTGWAFLGDIASR